MTHTVNRVETLTATGIRENGRRFELTFAAADGSKHTVSLPLRVAADLLPVFAHLSAQVERVAGSPSFTKRITSWAVGRSNEAPEVLFRLDDLALSFRVDDAKKMWRQLREEGPSCNLIASATASTLGRQVTRKRRHSSVVMVAATSARVRLPSQPAPRFGRHVAGIAQEVVKKPDTERDVRRRSPNAGESHRSICRPPCDREYLAQKGRLSTDAAPHPQGRPASSRRPAVTE